MKVATQARLWQWAAVLYGVCAVLFMVYIPTRNVQGQLVSLFELFGPSVLVPVSIPVLVAAVPALLPWRKSLLAWIVAGGLGVFIIATALSFGLLYLPSAVFSGVAGYLHHRAPVEDAPPPPDDWPGIVRHGPAGPT
ncbi:MAG: hypothetical protein QM779_07800 [Propionicimonas sp.]|uniref:hypothetical protein n=1 Tax=Propionicimonas sp. TaxID=1955623 RepID=UPI003D138924